MRGEPLVGRKQRVPQVQDLFASGEEPVTTGVDAPVAVAWCACQAADVPRRLVEAGRHPPLRQSQSGGEPGGTSTYDNRIPARLHRQLPAATLREASIIGDEIVYVAPLELVERCGQEDQLSVLALQRQKSTE